MATPKVTLEVDLKDKLTVKLNRMNKEIEARGGPAMVKLAKATRRAELDLKRLGGTAQKTNKIWTRFTKGIAIGNLAAIGAAKAIGAMVEGLNQVSEATKVAARIEVLGGVMQFTGQQAGYTAEQLDKGVLALRAQGIAQQEAFGLQQRFIQANLDIALATDIATVAQDAAVIAGVNSSEAALGLTDAIVKQRPILLKQFGIITDLDTIYNKAAESLGKKRSELTATEKRMGFYNEIMEQSTRIAGAYTTSMNFAGKQLTSLPRLFQDAQQAVGRHFLPAFSSAIKITGELAKTITSVFGDATDNALLQLEKLRGAQERYVQSSDKVLEMADRYDTLQADLNRSATEQNEMNFLLQELAKIQPGIVTGWNSMGEALGLNTKSLNDAVRAQRIFNQLAEEDAIDDLSDAFEDNRGEIGRLNSEMELLGIRLQGVSEGSPIFKAWTNRISEAGEEVGLLQIKQTALVTEFRAQFPDLIEGTDEWRIALTLASDQLVRMGLVSTIAAEKEKQAGIDRIATWDKIQTIALKNEEELSLVSENRADEEAMRIDILARQAAHRLEIALNNEEKFIDESNDGWDKWLRQHKFRNKAQLADWKETLRTQAEADRLHRSTLSEIDDVHFEASLVGLNEHIAAKMEAERAHVEWLKTIKVDTQLTDAEFNQARLDSLAILQEDIATITLEATEELTQRYQEKWAIAIDATDQAFTGLTEILISDTKFVGREMKKVFEDIGKSIAINLVKKGVKALGTYIFSLFAANTAAKLLGDGQKDATKITVLQSAATVTLAIATTGVATASGIVTGLMVTEGIVVKALTAKYIALAAAKNAASLGVTTGASIGAAVATKAALVPLLLDGFDDPINDRVAFRSGKDYADQFMAGTQTRFRAPTFGNEIVRTFPTPIGGDNGAPVGQPSLTVQVMGSIMSERDFMDIMKDVLMNFSDGSFDFDRTITGRPS